MSEVVRKVMKQLFLKKGQVFLQDVDVPKLTPNNILVRVQYSFISSGTEIATLHASSKSLFQKFKSNVSANVKKVKDAVSENGVAGTLALIKSKKYFSMSLGYSCSGVVVAVGSNVEKFKVGDMVACAGAGFANHAEVVTVPKNLAVKVLNKDLLLPSSLTTIGSIAMQGVRRADLRLGERVCVFGLGLIGQITVQLAKLSGCQVFGIDLQESRLELAKKLGADFIFNAAQVDLKKEIDFITNHYGVDTTIITASSSGGIVIQNAMESTRRKGKVVLVGDVKLDFDRDPFYSKEIDFLISCSYGPGRYDQSYELEGHDYPYSYVRWTENRNMELFVDLINKKQLDISPLISDVFELEKAESAYDYLKNNNALGVVLSYEQEPLKIVEKTVAAEKITSKNPVRRSLGEDGKLTTAVIGAGGFAKVKLLPLLSKNKNIKIDYIVDTDAANSRNISEQYGASGFGNDYQKIINNSDINFVVVATPHKLHAPQTIDLLNAGKAVFVEKPAVVNFDQLEQLENFLNKNSNNFYCVDFNRSFAPFNLAIKKELDKRKNPAIIYYRMNAGFIPKTHWIQSAQNRGRIIGEACHIFELFNFLLDAKPLSIAVQSINHNSDDLCSNDNVNVNIAMSDGSVCSLIYTSVGNGAIGKEHMEIFFDGKSILMDDYKTLNGFGLPKSFNKKTTAADKGHEFLLNQFALVVKKGEGSLPIPVERILLATRVSLVVDELAREGGGFRLLE
jgi:predicted dehydrogenase/threonine dehydrogenase-like Zn-dependent dehydrogenase